VRIHSLAMVAVLGSLVALPAAAESFTQGHVRVTVTREPAKRLDFEVVVPASRAQIWEAFTTPDGMKSWIAPEDKVDLAIGGDWKVGFKGSQPGGGNVLAWLPEEMLTVHAMAPEWFPTVRKERTIAVFRFDSVDEKQTRVRLSQIGWKDGPEWDKAFDYLSKGNAQLLNALYQRFAEGPVDWEKAAKH
jgi:uncharacterized protein YndB with AHSA1/START domain